MPSFLPASEGMERRTSSQRPSRTPRSHQGTRRTAASSSAQAWSATVPALVPGPWVTTMPRSRAASTSMPSNPAPTAQMISSLGMASMNGRLRP